MNKEEQTNLEFNRIAVEASGVTQPVQEQFTFFPPAQSDNMYGATYVPARLEDGSYEPLTKLSFDNSLQKSEKVMYEEIASENKVPTQLLYGIAETTVFPPDAPDAVEPGSDGYLENIQIPMPNKTISFPVSNENKQTYGPTAKTNNAVSSRNLNLDTIPADSPGFEAAVATTIMAEVLSGHGFTDTDLRSDKVLSVFYNDYMERNGRKVTPEQTKEFIKKVREYDVDTYFPKSIDVPEMEFNTRSVKAYNNHLAYRAKGFVDNRTEYWNRGDRPVNAWDANEYAYYPTLDRAANFYRYPERFFNTNLNKDDEEAYQVWLQSLKDNNIINQHDNGMNYDYRGYWQDYFKDVKEPPALQAGVHLPDAYKKPNHPTFSKESKYAKGPYEQFAGSWDGEKFIRPEVRYPIEDQQSYLDMMHLTEVTPEEETYSTGEAVLKKIQRFYYSLPISGQVTGFSAPADYSAAADTIYGSVTKNEYVESSPAEGKPQAKISNVEAPPTPEVGGFIQRMSNGLIPATATWSVSDMKELYKSFTNERIKDYLANPNILLRFLTNEHLYSTSDNVLIPGYKEEKPVYESDFFRMATEVFHRKPMAAMAAMFPALRSQYDALMQEDKSLQLNYIDEDGLVESGKEREYVEKQSELNKKYKNLLLDALLLQDALIGSTPAVMSSNTAKYIRTAFNNQSNISEREMAQLTLSGYVANNWQLASAVYSQLVTDYQEDRITQQENPAIPKYLAMGSVFKAYMPVSGLGMNREAVNTVLHGADYLSSGTVKLSEKERNARMDSISDKLSFFEDSYAVKYGKPYAQQALAPLKEFLLHVGYTNKEKVDYDRATVDEVINSFRDTFLISSKYTGAIIDKNTASIYGIFDEQDFTSILTTMTDDAADLLQQGKLVPFASGYTTADVLRSTLTASGYSEADINQMAEDIRVQKFAIAAGRPMPLPVGNVVLFGVQDKKGNMYTLADRSTGTLYRAPLQEYTTASARDRAALRDFTNRTGFTLQNRFFSDNTLNVSAELQPGRVSSKMRGRTANAVYQLMATYMYLEDIPRTRRGDTNVQRVYTCADNDYHLMLAHLKDYIQAAQSNPSAVRRKATDTAVEREFLNALTWYTTNPSRSISEPYLHLYEVPEVRQAFVTTANKFVYDEKGKHFGRWLRYSVVPGLSQTMAAIFDFVIGKPVRGVQKFNQERKEKSSAELEEYINKRTEQILKMRQGGDS